jgi:hypothetical protein
MAAAYILLRGKAVEEATIGPFKLKSLDAIEKSIVLLISYLAYTICNLAASVSLYQLTHDALMERFYPLLYKNDLETHLHPPGTFLSGEVSISNFFPLGLQVLVGLLAMIKTVFIILLPIIIAGAATFGVFHDYGTSDLLAIIAVCISFVLLLYTVLLTAILLRIIFTELFQQTQ